MLEGRNGNLGNPFLTIIVARDSASSLFLLGFESHGLGFIIEGLPQDNDYELGGIMALERILKDHGFLYTFHHPKLLKSSRLTLNHYYLLPILSFSRL